MGCVVIFSGARRWPQRGAQGARECGGNPASRPASGAAGKLAVPQSYRQGPHEDIVWPFSYHVGGQQLPLLLLWPLWVQPPTPSPHPPCTHTFPFPLGPLLPRNPARRAAPQVSDFAHVAPLHAMSLPLCATPAELI